MFDLVGNRLEKHTDKGNDGSINEAIKSPFDQNDRQLNKLKILNGSNSEKAEYTYNKTEQNGKTVTNLQTGKIESKTTMEYNAQGRISKTYIDGVRSKVITQEYEYDSSGIKVRQTETVDDNADRVVDTNKTTEYLNDDQNHTGYSQVLEERETTNEGTKVTTYTIGHDVLSQFDAVNGLLTLLTDGHGSTRAVADVLGNILQEYNYDAYGNDLGFNAAEALTSLLYSGEQFNPVSGLQYLRARWYNPQSGTFNRLDPFAGNQQSPLSFHKYAYAHMNPVMYSDPSGNSIFSSILITLAATSLLWSTATFAINPTVGNALWIGFDIVTFPVGIFKGLIILKGATKAKVAAKGFKTALYATAESSEKATRTWMAGKTGVEIIGKGENIRKTVNLHGKVVDIISYNKQNYKYILAEAKTTLHEVDIIKSLGKFKGTSAVLEKYHTLAGLPFNMLGNVDELVITCQSIKSTGRYAIDSAGKLLENGAPVMVDGIYVTIKQIPEFF